MAPNHENSTINIVLVIIIINIFKAVGKKTRLDIIVLLLFFDPGTQFPGNEKITLCNTKKYKNQAGMNLTPPPSQNSHALYR